MIDRNRRIADAARDSNMQGNQLRSWRTVPDGWRRGAEPYGTARTDQMSRVDPLRIKAAEQANTPRSGKSAGLSRCPEGIPGSGIDVGTVHLVGWR